MNHHKAILSFCFFFATMAAVLGTERTWTGHFSDDWFLPGNWSPTGVPALTDDVVISSGTAYATAPVTVSGVNLNGGTLAGTSSFTITNLTWSSGTMSTYGGDITLTGTSDWSGGTLAGVLSIASSGVLNLSGGDTKAFQGGTLTNHGTITWTGTGDVVFDECYGPNRIENQAGGLFDVQNDQSLYNNGCQPGGVFNNAGLCRKSAGAGTTAVNFPFNNIGTVDIQSGGLMVDGGYVQTAGATRVMGGSLGKTTLGAIEIRGGVLSGIGTINGDVTNAGEINPGDSFGTLTINGHLQHNGRMNLEVGGLTAGTQFDVLIVTNQAALNGWLSLRLKNGYRPSVGDSFEIVHYDSYTGSFNGLFGLDLGNGLVLEPVFSPTSLVLLATNGPVQSDYLTIAPFENGAFELRYTGLPNSNYVIQTSTTLTDWLNLFTNSSPIGVIEFLDLDAPLYAHRFYRARLTE